MWKEIIKNLFNHIWEFLVLLFSTLLSIFLTWYPASKINAIDNKKYMTVIIILLLIVFVLAKFIITTVNLINEKRFMLPHLKTIKNNRLIFEPSEIFSSQSIVSIYYKEDIEQYIGYGVIESIISDSKCIQVVINEYASDWNENKVSKVKNNIILKPSIPTSLLEKLGE